MFSHVTVSAGSELNMVWAWSAPVTTMRVRPVRDMSAASGLVPDVTSALDVSTPSVSRGIDEQGDPTAFGMRRVCPGADVEDPWMSGVRVRPTPDGAGRAEHVVVHVGLWLQRRAGVSPVDRPW